MKINKKTKEQEEIIDRYTVTGVPVSSIGRMCKDLNINEKAFEEWMQGQTMAVVGGEGLIYPWDIKKFLRGLPVTD